MLCDSGSPSTYIMRREQGAALMQSLQEPATCSSDSTIPTILDMRWSLQFKDNGKALSRLVALV